jgi:hypothetical protein
MRETTICTICGGTGRRTVPTKAELELGNAAIMATSKIQEDPEASIRALWEAMRAYEEENPRAKGWR